MKPTTSYSRRTFLTMASLAAGAPLSRFGKNPNIVFILADDIGYGDLGCYGATRVSTPNVDRLAKEGIRFTDAHAAASVCTPSRYSLLTGEYAWRNPAGDHIMTGEEPLSIKPGTTTVPGLLKRAGYTTGLVGKWHVGVGDGKPDWNGEIRPGPREVGFDYAYYFSATNDRVPCVYIENHRVVGLDPKDPIRVSYDKKVGDEPTYAENPELAKLKVTQGHQDTIINGISRIGFMAGGKAARYKDEDMADTLNAKAVEFIERNRANPFFLFFATNDIHQPRWPHQRFRGTSGCGLRCDTIRQFDASVGVILETLDRLKLAGNTLVILSSDNGPAMDDGYMSNDVRDANGHRPAGALRGTKSTLWEGGSREPFIARWPGRIKPGSQSDELLCLSDMLATSAALVGEPLPSGAGPDSFNLLPALLGEKPKKPLREHLVIQTNAGRALAIRKGNWKLIPRAKQEPELYDLAADPAETTNLASRRPEIVRELDALLAEIRQRGHSRL